MEFMLAALVFLSAIVLLFAKEFEAVIHKIAAIPGIKLILPLLLVSFFMEQYDDISVWFLSACQTQLSLGIQTMAAVLPFKLNVVLVSSVLFLWIIACMPIVVVWMIRKKSKTFQPIVSPDYVGYLLWMITVFLLITNI